MSPGTDRPPVRIFPIWQAFLLLAAFGFVILLAFDAVSSAQGAAPNVEARSVALAPRGVQPSTVLLQVSEEPATATAAYEQTATASVIAQTATASVATETATAGVPFTATAAYEQTATAGAGQTATASVVAETATAGAPLTATAAFEQTATASVAAQTATASVIAQTATAGVPLTATASVVAQTSTAAAAQTATAGAPLTATANAAATATAATRTPTVTGTPPTPTATGTITPNPAITVAVAPSEARVNQTFTFTIRLTNPGLAPAANVVVSNTFDTSLDLRSATSTKGSQPSLNTSTRTVTASVGTLTPNETVTITIIAAVNSSVTSNRNLSHSAIMTYSFNSISQSRSSNAVSYRVLTSSTLPGTGGMELEDPPRRPLVQSVSQVTWLAGVLAALLGLAALAAWGFAVRLRSSQWAGWLGRTGLLLSVAALLFGLSAWGLGRPAGAGAPLANLAGQEQPAGITPSPFILSAGDPWPIYPTPTTIPETLPDYPVPSPEVTAEPGQAGPDTSSVVQLEIPAIGVNHEVKYVPYDGMTWMIGGLKQEIAWMGDTSWPGLGGNTALAGHVTLRDGSDGPFRHLEDLRVGDRLTVSTERQLYIYQVREKITVSEYDLAVLEPSELPQLTLITCSGWDSELKLYLSRLAVVADLVEVLERPQQALSLKVP